MTAVRFFVADGTQVGASSFGYVIPRVGEKLRIQDVAELDNIPATMVVVEIVWQVQADTDSDAVVDLYLRVDDSADE